MPHFRYRAVDPSGRISAGEIVVESRQAALNSLSRRSQIPIELDEMSGSPSLQWWQKEVSFAPGLRLKTLALFTRELASLTTASLPIDEALRIIEIQPATSRRLRTIVHAVLNRLTEGLSLSESVAESGGTFPRHYVRLLRAGEASGSLSTVLNDLARDLDRATEQRSKFLSQLLYPAVLLLAAVAAMGIVVTVLVPAMAPVFADANVAPPAIISTLLRADAFLRDNAVLILVISALSLPAGIAALSTPSIRLAIELAVLRLPGIGSLVLQSQTARLARTLSALLSHGVPLTEAIYVGSDVLSSVVLRARMAAAGRDVEQGASLSSSLAQDARWPDLLMRLTRVGEETGELDTMMSKVAESYERAVNHRIDLILTLMTPALTLLIGAFVGWLILSVMGAILSINELVLP